MKPISSPGRTDKFPPPLMRFLRNNAASRSRGRSRSSTIFPRKKNTTTIETQEPTSPKVTCMGQVRVTRSSKQPAAKRVRSAAAAANRAPAKFRWVPNPLFRRRFAAKLKPCSSSLHCQCHCQPFWPNWGLFFRRKGSNSNVTEASTKPELNFRGRPNCETEEDETEQEQRDSVSNPCSTPPRNALLLMRCRSAPYSSSSLASRFWGSPLNGEERGEEQGKTEEVENRESNENQRQRESVLEQEGGKDLKVELKLRLFKELEDSLRERIMESEKGCELRRREEGAEEGDSAPRPLVLTRCKSEPARTAQRLDPEVKNFWKKRRLGFADSFYPHGLRY